MVASSTPASAHNLEILCPISPAQSEMVRKTRLWTKVHIVLHKQLRQNVLCKSPDWFISVNVLLVVGKGDVNDIHCPQQYAGNEEILYLKHSYVLSNCNIG